MPFERYAIKNTVIPDIAKCQSILSDKAAAIASKEKMRLYLRLPDILDCVYKGI